MGRDIDQINVIPLVDVMLVLLVIVLTTATFITTGQVPVQLARANESGGREAVPLVAVVDEIRGLGFQQVNLEVVRS